MLFGDEKILDSKLFVQNRYGEYVCLGDLQLTNIETLDSKSNNWLKMHGYKMRRRRGRKYKDPWRLLIDPNKYSFTIRAVSE